MADIFISYSHKDRNYVRELAGYLREEGLSVWVDESIDHGDRWWRIIVDNIEKCAAMIVVMTPESDETDWVQKEYMYANEIKKPLFPLLLKGDCFPFFINQQYHNVLDGSMPPEKFLAILRRLSRQKIATELKEKETEENRKNRGVVEAKRKAKEERKPKAAEIRHGVGKKSKQKEGKEHKAVQKTYSNSIGMKFILIPVGIFTMGSKLKPEEVAQKYGGNAEWSKCEHPQHEVTISKTFYLQSTAVTQNQWERIMGNNPSQFRDCGDDCPVEKVSWEDAHEFIKKLNKLEGVEVYRLPTEAEWEYACRTGTMTEFFFGDDVGDLSKYAWHKGNSVEKTHPVGKKLPNAWELYDMQGNVYEWVEDDYHDNYEGAPTNGRAWIDEPKGLRRVFRGGCWSYGARRCRSANRNGDSPDYRSGLVGFRLARSVAHDS